MFGSTFFLLSSHQHFSHILYIHDFSTIFTSIFEVLDWIGCELLHKRCYVTLNPVEWNVNCIIEFQRENFSMQSMNALSLIGSNQIIFMAKKMKNQKFESQNAMKSNITQRQNSFEYKEEQRIVNNKINWKIHRTPIESIRFPMQSGWNGIFCFTQKQQQPKTNMKRVALHV